MYMSVAEYEKWQVWTLRLYLKGPASAPELAQQPLWSPSSHIPTQVSSS